MFELEERPERALLIALDTGVENTEALLLELEELTKTAGAEVVATVTQKLPCPEKATFIGSGKLEEVTQFCQDNDIDLLIFGDIQDRKNLL